MRFRRPTVLCLVAVFLVPALTLVGDAGTAAVGSTPGSSRGPSTGFTTGSVSLEPDAPAPTPTVYVAPVPEPLRVLRPFDPPASPYGPGHRGVDLALAQGQVVRSAGDGTVSFAGQVAGRGVVVVAHPDGVRTEYEPVHPLVTTGTLVARGTVVGRLFGPHAGCGQPGCLHWGARRGAVYLDPLSLLRPLGPVRLLPWSGAGVGLAIGPP